VESLGPHAITLQLARTFGASGFVVSALASPAPILRIVQVVEGDTVHVEVGEA